MGMVVNLINGPWLFVHFFFNPALPEGSTWSLNKIRQELQRRRRSKVWTDGRTTDRRQTTMGGKWSQ